jgi:hypothetical protein
MKIRSKPKKSLSEFCSIRETTMKPINLITSGYKFSIQNEDQKIKYVSSVMNRAKSRQEMTNDFDKYRIFAGKLHVFNLNSESYKPIENNFHVDILRLTRRIQHDSMSSGQSARIQSPNLSLNTRNARFEGIKSAQNFMPGKKNFSITSRTWQM